MSETEVDYVGANAKMDEFRAAMGLCNLKYIDREIQKRKVKVERYRANLKGARGITLLPEQEGVISNYAYFPVLIEDEFPKTKITDKLVYENTKCKNGEMHDTYGKGKKYENLRI